MEKIPPSINIKGEDSYTKFIYMCLYEYMSSITCFDDLPDLVLIELFSYLSSVDILWGLTRLNHRLTMLTSERGFYHHINLSSAHCHQFNTILRFLSLNDIQSVAMDSDASPLQLTHWPYLPRLKTLRIIGVYNYDELSIFLLLHAATLTHLIIKSNQRLIPDGHTVKLVYPLGDIKDVIDDIILIHLPSLQSLDLGMSYSRTFWHITTTIVPLTYLRLVLPHMKSLVRLISTPTLSNTLRQLHVKIGNSIARNHCPMSTSNLLIRMVSLHTFTLVQTFFSMLIIDWTDFEMLTSSNVMPVLRRANMSLFITTNDLNYICSSPIFTDHRHVDVHFAFNLINCPQYIKVTQDIPRGNRFHPREIVGVTFVVNHWSDRSEWLINADPFTHGREYSHHMWYTLPWAFDEFFHEYVPYRWITKTQVFERPSQKMMTTAQSSLRTLDASGQMLISSPYLLLSDCIETLHLSFWNRSVDMYLSALRNITLVNSINYLNYCSSFPTTVRSIRILLFYTYPNYILPNWSVVLHSLSTLLQLSSLRVFMYDLPATVDDKNSETIAKIALLFSDFGFYFRYKFGSSYDYDTDSVFNDHRKFIQQLCDCIILLSFDKQFYYSIEDEGYGLTMWL